MKSSQVDVDGIMCGLGESKFFHITQYILICASVIISSSNSFFYVFFAITPEHRCDNLTQFQLNQYNISITDANLIYDKCSIDIISSDEGITTENRTLECLNGYHYTTPVDKSIVSQWDLVCNKEGLAESTQTFYTLGQVISGLLAPCLIETFGRKPMRILSHILLVIFNLISAFSPFYWMFASMRFFNGIVREAYILSSVTLVCELYSKDKRIYKSSMFMCIWAINNSSLGLIAYLLKDFSWNALFLFNAALSGYFVLDYLFLEESIRWLFANSKIKTAEKIVRKAAKQNKVDFDKVWSIALKEISRQEVVSDVNKVSDECQNEEPKVQFDGTIVDNTQPHIEKETSMFVKLIAIFKSPYLRKVTVVMAIQWAVDGASLNAILQMLEVFSGSIYINYTLMAVFEIIFTSLNSILTKRFGHKKTLQTFRTFVSVCIISTSLIEILAEKSKTMEYAILALYILSLGGLNAANCTDYVYTSELYPTQIRSVGNGFTTTFMRVVCMEAPFFKLLAFAIPWAPGIIIGVGCILASILLQVCVPETKNCVLPQTIEEVNKTEQENKSNVKIKTISRKNKQ